MGNKYLRRLMLVFFTSTAAHQASAAGAANKLKLKPICKGQSTYNCNNMQGAAPILRSTRASTDHYSSLPLQGIPCLPSSSAATSCNSSAGEGEYVISANAEEEKQLARSHSCSKLQGKQLVPNSLKSVDLLHRAASSHNRHSQSTSCKLHSFSGSPTIVSKYTRSWSSPSFHIRRHLIKLPHKAARSFSSREKSSSSSSSDGGKRAPKGHVAVYVEAGRERQVVPIAYLSHPHFQVLLKRAESEFGLRQQGPGLRIPCSLSELHHTLHHICTHH